jgi:hypothetical protein
MTTSLYLDACGKSVESIDTRYKLRCRLLLVRQKNNNKQTSKRLKSKEA